MSDAAAGADVALALSAAASIGAGPPIPGGPMVHTCCPACRAVTRDELDAIPRTIKTAQTFTLNGSGAGNVNLGGPQTGYRWTVRRVSIADAAGLGTSMGTGVAGVYAGTTASGVILPSNLEWIIDPLPNAATWGSEYLTLEWGESLVIAITGGNASESVLASVSYQLYGAARRRRAV